MEFSEASVGGGGRASDPGWLLIGWSYRSGGLGAVWGRALCAEGPLGGLPGSLDMGVPLLYGLILL